MGQRVLVQTYDDIDGTPGDDVTTQKFAVAGTTYEIDLNDANGVELLKALAKVEQIMSPFTAKARKLDQKSRQTTRARTPGAGSQEANNRNTAIRAWARENGIEMNPRGRIAKSIQEQYEAARRDAVRFEGASAVEDLHQAAKRQAAAAGVAKIIAERHGADVFTRPDTPLRNTVKEEGAKLAAKSAPERPLKVAQTPAKKSTAPRKRATAKKATAAPVGAEGK